MKAIESFHMKCQRRILGIRWHDFVRNCEVSLRTGLAPLSDRITRGRNHRNAIFGHVTRMPDNTPAHQAMLRQVELSVSRPQTLHGNVHEVDHVPNGPTNSAATTTMFLRLCGGKPLVTVTRERRYGPSRLRVNDADDDDGTVLRGNYCVAEADLGMFSMFGRTGALTKRGPHKRTIFFIFLQHGKPKILK